MAMLGHQTPAHMPGLGNRNTGQPMPARDWRQIKTSSETQVNRALAMPSRDTRQAKTGNRNAGRSVILTLQRD